MAKQFTVGHFHGLDRILRKAWSAPWNGLIHDAAPEGATCIFLNSTCLPDYRREIAAPF
jgi:hypothetical protein